MAQQVKLDGFGIIEMPDSYTPDDITRHLNSREFKSFVEVNDPSFYDQHYDQSFIDHFQNGLSDGFDYLTENLPDQVAAYYYDLVGNEEKQRDAINAMQDYAYQRSLMGKPVKDFTELFTDPSTFGDWMDWIAYNAGNGVASSSAAMATAIAAAGAATVAPLGVTAAGAAGAAAVLAGSVMGIGDVYQAQVDAGAEDPNAAITTALAPIYGAAERLGIGALVPKLLTRGLASQIGKEAASSVADNVTKSIAQRALGVAGNVVKQAAKTGAAEGLSESLQGGITDTGGFLDTPNNNQSYADFITSNDFIKSRINDAAAGAVGGIAVGGAVDLSVAGYNRATRPSTTPKSENTRNLRRNIVPEATPEAVQEASDFATSARDTSRMGQLIGLRETESFKPNENNEYKVLSDFTTTDGRKRAYVFDPATKQSFFVDRDQIYEPETLTPDSLIGAIAQRIKEDDTNPSNAVDEEYVGKLLESDLSQYKDTPSIKQFGDMEELAVAVRDHLERQEEEPATNSSPYTGKSVAKARESLKAAYRGYSEEYIDSLSDEEAVDLATSGSIFMTPEEENLLNEFNVDSLTFKGKGGRDRLNFLKENAATHRAILSSINNVHERAAQTEAAREAREEKYKKERDTTAFVYGPENRAKFSAASGLDYDLTKGKYSPIVLKAAQETLKNGEQFLTQPQIDKAKSTIASIAKARATYENAISVMELPPIKDWDNYARQKDTPFKKLQRQVNKSAIASAPKLPQETQDGVNELWQLARDLVMQIAPHASPQLMELQPDNNMVDEAAIIASGGNPKSTASAAGAYDPLTKMIWVSLNGSMRDIADATIHELVHYLEDNNFFSDSDQNIILNAMPFIRTKAIEIIQTEINPNVNPEDVFDYEARAIYIAHYLRARMLKRNDVLKKIPTSLRGIANRVYKLFDFVTNWINNRGTEAYAINKIFDDIGNGQKRKPIGNKQITDTMLKRVAASVSSVVRGVRKPFTEENFRNWFRDSIVTESAVTETAIPKTVYHATRTGVVFEGEPGTQSQADTFRRGNDIGIHFGTQRAANQRVGHFDKRPSDKNRIIPVYLSLQNPIDMPDMNFWEPVDIIDQLTELDGYPPGSMYRSPVSVRVPGYGSSGRDQLIVFTAEEADALTDSIDGLRKSEANDLIIEAIKKKGFDGFTYVNVNEDAGSTSYVVFDPTQIKSIFNDGTWGLNNGNISASVRPTSDSTTPSIEKDTFSTEETDAEIEKDAAILQQFIPRPDMPRKGTQDGGLVNKDISKFSSFVNSMRHMARKNKFFAAINNIYHHMGIYKNWHSNEVAKYGRILSELDADQLNTVGKAIEAVVHLQKQFSDNPDVPKRYRPDAQGRIIIQAPEKLGPLGSNSTLRAGEVIILTGKEAQAYVDMQDGFNYILTENKRGYMHHKVPFIRNMLNKYIPNSPIAANEAQATKEAFEKFGSQAPALTLNPLEDVYVEHLMEIRSAIESRLDGAMASLFGPGMALGEMPSGGWRQNIKDGKLAAKLKAVSKEIAAIEKHRFDKAKGKKVKKRNPKFAELLDQFFPDELSQLRVDIDKVVEDLIEASAEYNDITDIASNIRDFDSLLARDYMPLMRFGDHFIAFKDDTGKIVWYEQLEFFDETTSSMGRLVKNTQLNFSDKKREEFANRRSAQVLEMLRGKGINAVPVTDDMGKRVFDVTKGNLQALPGMSAQSINLLFSQLHRAKNLSGSLSQSQLDLIRDEVQKMIDGRGFSRFMKERDLVPGYTIDLRRAFAQYAMTGIYTAAAARYKPALAQSVNQLKENFGENTNLYKYAVAAQNYIESPMEELEKLRSLSFFYHLGGNLSSGLLQVIGAAQFSLPYIAQFAGNGSTASAFRKAFTDIAPAFSPIIRDPEFPEVALDIGKLPTDKGMKEALMRALEAGTLKQGAFLDMMGYGPDERIQNQRSAKIRRNISNLLAAPFSTFETMTRLTTFTAAYRLARDNPAVMRNFLNQAVRNDEALKAMFANVETITPYDFATVMVDDTLGLFGKGNRPPFMRGAGGLIFQFQFYPLQMFEFLATLFKNYKTNKKAIAGVMLMLLVTSGLSGLPGADDAEKLISVLMKKSGLVDEDLRVLYREIMYEMGSPGWATELFEKGAFNSMGFDVQRRVGFGELPGSQQAQAMLGLSNNQADMFGAPGAMVLGSIQGFYDLGIKQGRWGAALEYALPSLLRNPVRAYNYSQEGVRSRSGLQIVPEGDLSLGELAGKAIGFQPNRISLAYQREAEVRDLESVLITRKTAVSRRLENAMYDRIVAAREGNRKAYAEADAEVTEIFRKLVVYNNNSPMQTRISLDGPTMRQIMLRIQGRFNPDNRIIRDVPKLQRYKASETIRRYDDQFFNKD